MKPLKTAVLGMLIITMMASTAAAGEKLEFPRRNAIVKVVEKVRDSVVNISTERIVIRKSPWDDMFPFFDEKPSRKYKTTSLGSGIIIDEDGYIITNAHVVKRATRIKVKLADKTEYDAKLISMKIESDLALLKIDAPKKLKAITLGTSKDLMIGETAIALGNPFGLSNTVTVGVISAKNRSITIRGQVVFKDFLQTDAAINPGNSGGPLVNINGELIGVNTAIHSGATGIGFAIPVDRLKAKLRELVAPGQIAEVHMGFAVSEEKGGKLVVMGLSSDGPAEKAGFKIGDVLVAVEGDKVHDVLDLAKHIITKKPGDSLGVTLGRAGKFVSTTITLARPPETLGQKASVKRMGLTIRRLPPYKAREKGLEFKSYIVVDSVEAKGPGSRIGFKAGDVIIELAVVDKSSRFPIVYSRQKVRTYSDVCKFLDSFEGSVPVSITVLRRGNEGKYEQNQGILITR